MREPSQTPFPLDGGRVGDGGVRAELAGKTAHGDGDKASRAISPADRGHTPNPALPPSRGKGVFAHPAHATGAINRARRLRREMTLPERKRWEELRKLKLNVRRQVPLGRYVADFACHSASIVIELDGPLHDLPENAVPDDKRTHWLQSQGYRVLRFTNKQVMDDLLTTVETIEAALKGKAA